MAITAKRFNMLDQETHAAVADFQNIVDTQILNSNLNINKQQQNDIIDVSNALINNNGNLLNGKILSVMNNPALTSPINAGPLLLVYSLAEKSPFLADVLNRIKRIDGPNGLEAMSNKLMKQITSGEALKNFKDSSIGKGTFSLAKDLRSWGNGINVTNHLPDFSGTLEGIPGISGIVNDLSNFYKRNNSFASGLSPFTNVRFKNTFDSIHLPIGKATSAQISTLVSKLHNNPVAANLIKTLPPVAQHAIAGAIINDLNNSTMIQNGRYVPLNNSQDTNQFISSINNINNVNYNPVINNTTLNTSLINAVVKYGIDVGLPNIYSSLTLGFTDKVAIVNAGSSIINSAANVGNVDTIIDVASTPYILSIATLQPNLINTITTNYVTPTDVKNDSLITLSNNLINAINNINPSWTNSNIPNTTIVNNTPVTVMTTIISLNNLTNSSSDFINVISNVVKNTNYVVPDMVTNPTVKPSVSLLDIQWVKLALEFTGVNINDELVKNFGLMSILPIGIKDKFVVLSPVL